MSAPFVVALLGGESSDSSGSRSQCGSATNEASLWNLDTGRCAHVFRVCKPVTSDKEALQVPTLESIPLSVDPSWTPGIRVQGASASASRRDYDYRVLSPNNHYLSSEMLFGSAGGHRNTRNDQRQGQRQSSRSNARNKRGRSNPRQEEMGMRCMLWTPDSLPGASTPHLITAGGDTCIRIWDMYTPHTSFAVPQSSSEADSQYFESVNSESDVGGYSSNVSSNINLRSRGHSFSSSNTNTTNNNTFGNGGGNGVSGSNLTLCQTVPLPPGNQSGATCSGMLNSAHDDAVMDLKMVRSEHHALLLSSGRDGVVNVWRSDWLVANVNAL